MRGSAEPPGQAPASRPLVAASRLAAGSSHFRRALALRRTRLAIVATVVTFAAASAAIAVLEAPPFDVPSAGAVYLVPVVVAATLGTVPAVTASIVAFLAYDVLFVEPRFTLGVDDQREWLDLVLFLVIGVTIGRLVAREAMRSAEAERRLREAGALFAVSRTLATSPDAAAAMPAILEVLRAGTAMDGIRVTRGSGETLVGHSGDDHAEAGRIVNVLARQPGEEPARWVRAHDPVRGRRDVRDRSGARDPEDVYRVGIDIDGHGLGSLWLTRRRDHGPPTREETRLLSLAADQIALSWERERLAAEARDAVVAMRSEAAQSALLESVSHDLRTPLASIRASAGGLADPAIDWPAEQQRAAAQRIDNEAERLNRLVTNLLDLSRIEGGSLVPRLEPHDLVDLLEPALARLEPALPRDHVSVEVPGDLPPVLVDPVLFDQALANILDNAVAHAAGARLTVRATANRRDDRVLLRIEDSGPGVPDADLARLFDRFYRATTGPPSSRRGLGIGLAIVRGAIEAMGGRVAAEHGSGGGLGIVLDLPYAAPLSAA